MGASNRVGLALSRFGHSFSLKLTLLTIVLLTVPVALYWQFRRYEDEQAVVLRNALEQTSRLITAIVRPHLANFPSEGPQALRDALARAAVAGTSVKILLQPAADSSRGGQAKTKNGKGVYKAPNGTTCVKGTHNQGCK